MPRQSRSRSRDRKRDHRYKDSKKRHSRSRSIERRDRRRDEPRSDRRNNFDNNGDSSSRRGGNFSDQRPPAENYRANDQYSREEHKDRSYPTADPTIERVLKKSNRFSDAPLTNPPQNISTNHSSGSMMPPPTEPGKRKKFVWRDAYEEELKDYYVQEKRMNHDENSPALMFGANPHLMQNLNPTILNALQDSSKIKKKIYLPKSHGVNYIGLLIGPRGLYQKRLEEESGCKILIRGKGSQKEGSAPQPDDDDEQHVLVIGDKPESVRRAQNAIERVISADDTTRNKIREEQQVVTQQINNQLAPGSQMDDSMMTPYGPPSPYAYIIPVPNDCVGLIIGKSGDTIRQLQMDSGAKIQVAKKEIPNSNLRNVFVEGPTDKYQRAKEMIEEIIRDHRRTADPQIHVGEVNPFSGPHSKIKVPDKYVGLIIGKNQENLKGVAQASNTKIFVPQKNIDPDSEDRTIEVDGDQQSIELARQEIFNLINKYVSSASSNNYDYQKNPYGSGIAVYNQTKLASDGQTINGAVPDSLKPESGSYASSLLTENPMMAYASMQLTGWGDYNNQQESQYNKEGGEQQPYYGQEGYDQNYYNNYYGQQQQTAYPGYDQQQYADYYQQYYGGQYPPQQPAGDQQLPAAGAEQPVNGAVPQNPEVQPLPSADAAATGEQPVVAGQLPPVYGEYPPGYNQEYYNQYYQQYYYGQQQQHGQPGTGEAQAYYQQYYPTQEQEQAQQQPPTDEEDKTNQQPGQ